MMLIACLDDKGGMLFGGRRQSKDRVLREHLLGICRGKTLWMTPYSAAQFDADAAIQADTDAAQKVQADEVYFLEDGAFPDAAPTELLLYRWNRRYPADRRFPFDPLEKGYRLISKTEFSGSSHEVITAEHYKKE